MPGKQKSAVFFLAGLAVLIMLSLVRSPLPLAIDTNMFNLLPASSDQRPVLRAAIDHVKSSFEKSQVFVVTNKDRDVARAAAMDLAKTLEDSGLYDEIIATVGNTGFDEINSFYASFRSGLLDATTRQKLIQGDTDFLVDAAIQEIYSPLAFGFQRDIQKDPFRLLPGFITELGQKAGNGLDVDDGLVTFQDNAGYHVVVRTRLANNPFVIDYQQQIEEVTTAAQAKLQTEFSGTGVIISGVVQHAINGTHTAEGEIQTVGLGSLLGVIFLLIVVFRAFRPLLGVVVTLGGGIIAGFFACLLVFQNVHVLTLISGGSLIGVAVDYTFHFLAHHSLGTKGSSATKSIASIKRALLLGWLTSVISFSVLIISGFPGLEQIAVFSVAGLTAALLSVFLFYPALFDDVSGTSGPDRFGALAGRWLAFWQTAKIRKIGLAAMGALGLFSAFQIPDLEMQDDVRFLNFRNGDAAIESPLEARTGGSPAGQFFLITGVDAETALQKEEQLASMLSAARDRGDISAFTMISDFIPSLSRQKENRALMQTLYTGAEAPIDRLASVIGLTPDPVVNETGAMTFEDFTSSPFAGQVKGLWMTGPDGTMATIVALKGVRNLTGLEALATDLEGVSFVDYVGVMSETIGQYREQASYLLLGAYVVIILLMFWKYGLPGFLGTTVIFLGTAIIITGTLAFLGQPLNLFHVIGGVLVFGIGVDYIIFLLSAGGRSQATMLAIILSAITTMLAFGLLSFSALGALHAFGFTVMLGIALVFLLAPMMIVIKNDR